MQAPGWWASARRATHSAAVAKSTRWPAWQARIDSPMARWVLPVPGGPRNTTFSLASTKSRAPEVGDDVALQAALVVEVELLEGLSGREAGRPDADLAAVGLAGGHLALETGGQELLVGPALGPGPLGQALDRPGRATGP